jgi:DNA modification methylase
MNVEILHGDCRQTLKTLPDASVNCCVTSPPYFGLRDYGTAAWIGGDSNCDHKQGRSGAGRADGVVDERSQRNRDGVGSMGGNCRKCGAIRVDSQIGLEESPDSFVRQMVTVFREVRRVLRDDGTLWLNLGDSYAAQRGGTHQPAETLAGGKNGKTKQGANVNRDRHDGYNPTRFASRIGLKHKDLIGIPWRVAFALQADGWYLRQDIIWHKPNPMPESVTDRCTKAHEYIFLLSKSARYFYDAQAVQEPCSEDMQIRAAKGHTRGGNGKVDASRNDSETLRGEASKVIDVSSGRNRRSVWTVTTKPYRAAHFATFPPDLIRPCILAGCPTGGTVLDPFGGSGTTGQVAMEEGRNAILCELNADYVGLIRKRIGCVTPSLFGRAA